MEWCQGETDAVMKSLESLHLAGVQLLRSSSVAVSTSQDFEDKAAITAFCMQGGNAVKIKPVIHKLI